ncbi:unnamed protein product [Discula destructiva]
MPPYQITGCSLSDAADVARNNMSAFWEDPNWRYIWKDTDLASVIRQSVNPQTGKFMGYIRWKLPVSHYKDGTGRPNWLSGQVPDVSPREKADIKKQAEDAWWYPENPSDRLDDQLRAIQMRILGTKDYLVLDHFAVHPENQGKGAGLALLKHGIQEAQELGLDIYVMALAGGFGIYDRMGFKLLDSLVQDATPFGGNENYAVRFMEYTVNEKVAA